MSFIVGIDCAAQDKNAGLALGEFKTDRIVVHEVIHSVPQILPVISNWTREFEPILFALDSPLGWPTPLGAELSSHSAGQPIFQEPDLLFSRMTDRVVRQMTGKKPLEVGADRIARTALRAIKLLGEIRKETGLQLPVPMTPGVPSEPSVIEVYPATGLISRSLSERGYKGKEIGRRQARGRLLQSLTNQLELRLDADLVLETDDGFDAMICLICAMDYLNGDVVIPPDRARAASEGWIWFNSPDSRS